MDIAETGNSRSNCSGETAPVPSNLITVLPPPASVTENSEKRPPSV